MEDQRDFKKYYIFLFLGLIIVIGFLFVLAKVYSV